MTIPGLSTTAYTGIKEKNPPNIFFRNRNPVGQDFRLYDVGDLWQNTTSLAWFILSTKTLNVAQWVLITGTPPSGDIVTINGQSPDAAGDFLVVNESGAGAITVTTPGSAGANSIGLTVRVDTTTINIVGNE